LQPDNPVEWLNRAKSSLAIAIQPSGEIYPEDLCFQAQQAAEKAIKAVYISKKVSFPYIHDISQLLAALEKEGVIIPLKKNCLNAHAVCSSNTVSRIGWSGQ
jgi:HEPN domain-containing protein